MAQRVLLRPLISSSSSFLIQTRDTARCLSTVVDIPVVRPSTSVFKDAVEATAPRTNWTRDEIAEVYNTPLMELTYASVCFLPLGSALPPQ